MSYTETQRFVQREQRPLGKYCGMAIAILDDNPLTVQSFEPAFGLEECRGIVYLKTQWRFEGAQVENVHLLVSHTHRHDLE